MLFAPLNSGRFFFLRIVEQTLVILEAMITEFLLTAPCNGIVTRILSESGDRVSAAQGLAVIEEQL